MLKRVESPIGDSRFDDLVLVSSFLERRWGQGTKGELQIEIVYLAASSATNITVVPDAPYAGMVVHSITLNRLLPGAMQLTLSHREVAQHTIVLSTDVVKMPFWAWVTEADPLNLTITNRLSFDAFLGLTLRTINF